ncbi:MAG TPA: TPM domain-containing protein [Bacteroidales bacterium]|nr:TPM domain-containing protein [Bacteroidales bacterium]
MKTQNILRLFAIALIMLILPVVQSQEIIPERPSPPRLVNDFTGTLNASELDRLEQKLVAFNDTTSTQIAVVLVNTLGDYDKAQFADLLGEKWGVGHKGKDNGLVVLVKPKTAEEKGEAFIATGYGLEGAVPDAVVKRIVEEEMIPYFMRNRYFEGLDRATDILMSLTAGEFTAEEYINSPPSLLALLAILIPLGIFVFFVVFISSFRKNTMNINGKGTSGLPLWTALFLASQMGQQNGKWDSFTSGGSSFGSGGFGGGGGFGGFGGGSFGGGGAGGSW